MAEVSTTALSINFHAQELFNTYIEASASCIFESAIWIYLQLPGGD